LAVYCNVAIAGKLHHAWCVISIASGIKGKSRSKAILAFASRGKVPIDGKGHDE